MDSAQWDERYRGSELLWSAGPNRFLVEEVGDLAPGRALELACGEGRNALWLCQQGWRVSASDFSPVAIAKARARAAELGLAVDFAVADARAATEEGACELVIVMYLQLPASEMREVLANASRALAPGGTLLVVGHDRRNLAEGYGGPRYPEVLYGPDDVTAWLPGDLEIVRAATVERPVEKDGTTHVALDVLVRARKPGA